MEYNYTHGGDVYRNPIEYDFSINVNPLGMPLASIQAAHEGIVLTGRYPDYRAEQLCRAIAKAQNIPADRIIPGNGAAELLYALGQTIPGKALAIAPTFTGYAEAVAAGGGEMCYAGCEDADGDVDDMSGQDRLQFDSETVIQRLLAKLDDSIRLVFLCNPNNPTGRTAQPELLREIVRKCTENGVKPVVDECFNDFLEDAVQHTLKDLLESNPGLIILRAYTKMYAVPGVRFGWCMTADAALIEAVTKGYCDWKSIKIIG